MSNTSDDNYYIELISVSIAGIVAANLWNKFLDKFISEEFGDNIYVYLASATLITILIIYIVHKLFSKKKIEDQDKIQ